MKLIFVLLFLLSSASAIAEPYRFWVIGSFSNQANAQRLSEDLHNRMGVTFIVDKHPSKDMHRVLVDASAIEKTQLTELGFSPWLLVLNEPESQAPDTQPVADSNINQGPDQPTDDSGAPQDVSTAPATEPAPSEQAITTRAAEDEKLEKDLTESPLPMDAEPRPETAVEPPDEPAGPDGPLFPEILAGESITEYCVRVPQSPLCQHPDMRALMAREQRLEQNRRGLSEQCQSERGREEEICRTWQERSN